MSHLRIESVFAESRQAMPRIQMLQRIRVPIGLALSLSLLIFSKPSLWTIFIGCSLAFIGILIRTWASGHIRKNVQLAVSGPYVYTRNPLYFGTFLIGTGFTFASSVWWIVAVFVGFFLLIYVPVMQAESIDLERLFGEDFKRYAKSVPLFIPSLRSKLISTVPFDLTLYREHREYQAMVGFFLALAFLAVVLVYR